MESTDTPDFFYDDDDNRGDINNKIGFTDGIMGSTGLDKMKEQSGNSDPGVAGALDVDPNVIGGYVSASAEAAGVKFELDTLAKMGRFQQEVSIEMPAASDAPRLETIFIKPVCAGRARLEETVLDDFCGVGLPSSRRTPNARRPQVHGLRGLLRRLGARDACRVHRVARAGPHGPARRRPVGV